MERKSIIQDKELLQFIPQRDPFVMVDKLFENTENSVVSGFTIADDNVLVQGNIFQESGLIENMAQTCALYAGFKANKQGKAAPVGYIAGIKSVVIKRLPQVGDHIHTKIEITNELMNMQIAMASVYSEDEELLAGCELRIFINED